MQISMNGSLLEIADGSTAEALVIQLGLAEKRIAMELNQTVIPRSQYPTTVLKPTDVVEIVHAIGGG
ncbi:MAG: sulfur carrier protein [Gammaproteobacteria bacterium]|jgi:sulfur carrier protein